MQRCVSIILEFVVEYLGVLLLVFGVYYACRYECCH